MGRHVSPHRWADAEAGRLSRKELARAEAHARSCDACAVARDRVRAARIAMVDIGEIEPEDMLWDEVGAKIYWSQSTAQREAVSSPRRPWAYGVAAAALAAGVAAAYVMLEGGVIEPAKRVAKPAPAAEPAAEPVRAAEPEPLIGVVAVAAGDVTLDGSPLGFDTLILAGQTLATAGGARVTVQFGADSAFTLGENTTLSVTDLDTRSVQLDVAGTVDVRVSHRAPNQRFAVIAGSRRVVVRGTVFRVAHRGETLEVICTDGRVAVLDGDHATEVRAGEHLRVLDVLAASGVAKAVPANELENLERSLQAPLLAVFEGAREAIAASARLDVAATARNAVTVDGIAVGRGAAAIRVLRGRHHVEVGKRARWIEVGSGEARAVAIQSTRRKKSVRAPQLDKALDQRAARLRVCARELAAHGIAEGSYVTLEIGINRDGSQGYLNVLDSNVSSDARTCVKNVVDSIELPAGPAERIVQTIPFGS